MSGESIDRAALQAEAEGWHAEFVELEVADHALGVRRKNNRHRGRRLIASMRAAAVDTLTVGSVVLRPARDGQGIERSKRGRPFGRSPHAPR